MQSKAILGIVVVTIAVGVFLCLPTTQPSHLVHGEDSKQELDVPKPNQPDGKTHFITFDDDLKLDIKEDSQYEVEWLNDRVKELNGQRVKIRGFMDPNVNSAKGIKKFVFVKNTECKFGPGGTACHVIIVEMEKGMSTRFTTRVITLEGKLTIDPYVGFDGNTWSLYRMKVDKLR